MGERDDQLESVFANQTAWITYFATADQAVWRGGVVTACQATGEGSLLIPAAAKRELAAIDAGLDWLQAAHVKRILIWTDRDDRDLDIALASRGMSDCFRPRWMRRDLVSPLPDLPVPAFITIDQATLADLPALEAATDLPYVNLDEAQTILAPGQESTFWTLVARASPDGRIVGHLTIFLPQDGSHWAGLYSAGVVPARQRRGIGSALTHAGCRVARDAGARSIGLNATPDGERAYRTVGFEMIGDGRTWMLGEHSLRHRRPHAATIAWAEHLAHGAVSAIEPARAMSPSMPNGESPLSFAARFDQGASARWLLRNGATPEIGPLWRLGFRAAVVHLLRDPAAVNRVSQPGGKAPLHAAIEQDDRELAELLLDAAADVSIRDETYGGTPLDWARHLDRPTIVTMIEARTDGTGRAVARPGKS